MGIVNTYSSDEIIEEVKKLAERLGRIPAAKDAINDDDFPFNIHTIMHRFGNWKRVLRIAKLNPDRNHSKGSPWTKEEIISGIQRLKKELGRTPKAADLKPPNHCDYLPCSEIVRKHFGSWANALLQAGLKD